MAKEIIAGILLGVVLVVLIYGILQAVFTEGEKRGWKKGRRGVNK